MIQLPTWHDLVLAIHIAKMNINETLYCLCVLPCANENKIAQHFAKIVKQTDTQYELNYALITNNIQVE